MGTVQSEKLENRMKIFETVLSSPGMNEKCKIVLSLSRQTILVLSRFVENGLENKDKEGADELLTFLPEASVDELKTVLQEILKKGELSEFYGRLKQL